MKIFFLKYRLSRLMLGLVLLCQGCANIVPPDGGPKDTTPPVLLSVSPEDSSLNVRIKKIELRFNKFMEVKAPEKHFHISPFLRIDPMIMSYGKRVVVTLADTLLEESTTYRIQFGEALVDNRESTPFAGYEYIFSTGGFFDSLRLSGQVRDAASGLPDSGFVVVLYPGNAPDSAVFREKPLYATPVDARGYFEFTHLPSRDFRIFALQDADNNYLYLPGTEKIDFHDTPVRPGQTEALLFFPFREELAVEPDATDTIAPGASGRGEETGGAKRSLQKSGSRKTGRPTGQPYLVLVDTSRLTSGTFDITAPLTILASDTLLIDSQLLYLSFDDEGIEVEAPFRYERDSAAVRLHAEWQPDKLYTLRLVKGWARGSNGSELLPGKYFFRTRSEKEYGNLQINLDTSLLGEPYVLHVARDTSLVYQQPVQGPVVQLNRLEPGNYVFKIIVDTNQNGRWDAGNFLEKRHAEKVLPAGSRAVVKAGWDNRFDFVLADAPEDPDAPDDPDAPEDQDAPEEDPGEALR